MNFNSRSENGIYVTVREVYQWFLDKEYTVFINGGRAEQPGFECMNARLDRLENTWRAHRVVFHLRFCDYNFSQNIVQIVNTFGGYL